MSDVIKLVQGDSRPQLAIVLTDENTGDVIDITGATVVMHFRAAGASGILETLTGGVTSGVDGECVIPWNPTSLDVAEGEYEGEVQVTFADTTVQTAYKVLRFRVRAEF